VRTLPFGRSGFGTARLIEGYLRYTLDHKKSAVKRMPAGQWQLAGPLSRNPTQRRRGGISAQFHGC
jgi:hypothetical protein